MQFLTHIIGITSSIRAQHGIDLPGSLHTNTIPIILGRYPLLGFFCRLNILPLDRDNGTFNSSNTDVVEKVNFVGGCFTTRGYFGGGRIPIAHGQKWLCFGHFSRGGSFVVDFLKNKILGFDENFEVVLLSDLQQCVMLQFPPRQSVCVRTAPGNVNMVAYGKIYTRLSPPVVHDEQGVGRS